MLRLMWSMVRKVPEAESQPHLHLMHQKSLKIFLFETNSEAMKIQDKKELISGNIGQKELIQLILNKYCKIERHLELPINWKM